MDQRNAASVLPDPVGATTSACEPELMASHAPDCAGVGSANAPVNQSRVAGENRSSALLTLDILPLTAVKEHSGNELAHVGRLGDRQVELTHWTSGIS
jgi:hypothetical protein